jgi:hypothetical protein
MHLMAGMLSSAASDRQREAQALAMEIVRLKRSIEETEG